MMWQEISLSSLQPGDPPQMKLFGTVLRKKLRDRDEANAEKIADLDIDEGSTTSNSWVNVKSREIRIPPDFKKLTIKGWLQMQTIIGTYGTAHVRFNCSTVNSTEDQTDSKEIIETKDPFSCEIDLTGLSGIQTLNMQLKTARQSGSDTITAKGKVRMSSNERRYDSYFSRV